MKTNQVKLLLALLIVSVLLVGCAAKDEVTVRIEADEGTQLKFDISPDGSQIVFDLLGQLWTIPIEGGLAAPITDAVADTSNDTDPIYSPDGSFIVFCSDRPGGVGLYTFNLADGSISRLTDSSESDPAFSSDGDKLAFVRRGKIGVCNLADKTISFPTIDSVPSAWLSSPAWMPGDERIMFVSSKTAWVVSCEGGIATSVADDSLYRYSPCLSPAGGRLAYFANDSTEKKQIFVANADGSDQTQLTDHTDVFAGCLRWSSHGKTLIYTADGKLWKVSIDSKESKQIPFSVKLSFQRKKYKQKQVTFPNSGDSLFARGHMGLGISPDGNQFAMIALGKLWVAPIGGIPHEICTLPFPVAGLSWHPDGTRVAWSAGVGGAEDIYETDIQTRETKQLTDLPGREVKPAWSPDGSRFAFVHWEKPALPTDPWLWDDVSSVLRVVDAKALPVTSVDTASNLGSLGFDMALRFLAFGQEVPQWGPDSRRLLVTYANVALLMSSDAEQQQIDSFPAGDSEASFINWGSDSTIYYIFNDQPWKVTCDSALNVTGEPKKLSEAAAQYLSVANDGTALFLSADGLRTIKPDGSEQVLGWPLQFTTPAAEPPLLIRNARILDGTPHMTARSGDILIEKGMISRIAGANLIAPDEGINVIDAEGRTVIPGLINLHEHTWDEIEIPALLYYGITTFKDMGSPLARLAGLRDAIAAGVLPGPRIVFGGWQIWGDEGLSAESGHCPQGADGMERAASLLEAFGADYVKNYMFSNIPHMVNLIEKAHSFGWSISGHIAAPLPLVAAGNDGMEHLSVGGRRTDKVLYDDMVQLFRASNMWVVPTVICYSSSVRFAEDPSYLDCTTDSPFISPLMRWWGLRLPPGFEERYTRFAREAREGAIKLHKAGVTVGAGSDTPSAPWALHWELEEMVAAGMTPAEALCAATSVAASILGADKEIGTIAVGKRADLVILNADPLEDISNTQDIWNIIKDGKQVDRDSLLALGAQWLD